MKKIVSLILSLVMLLSITSGLNLTAYADDVNHYLDFQAEIYSSETAGFDNIFVGTDSSSFSRTLYNNLKNDTKFQVTLAAWSSTHIVDDATYTIENNAFKKKDLYDAILFDMIDSTDESTLCQQYQNEFEKLYKMVKNERSSYVIKTTDMILGKENYTVEQLKTTDLSEDAKDLLLNGTKYAGVTSVISEVNKILGNVKNAYDAINAVADYLAIKDVDCGTSEILNEIASDSQSPIELRYSAAEISDCMAGAYGKTAALIAEGSISGIEFALNKAINYAWDSVLACIPGGTAISFGAKTGRMLVNYFFKTETVIQGYYQLEAAVNIEDAIIRVMQNKKNADTGYTNIDSAVYMKSVDMYKDIILLGFDYSIELLQNAANSDFNTATDFWLGNYSQCMQLIDQIQELKQKKIDNFVKYEEIVFNKYKSLYLPNYDELEDEISKTVPVTALSVTQLVDINIGDSAYFEDCFAYNFEPYNYTESVTNVSVTSSDSNIISVVKGDDSKEKFVANNAGTCTLTFTLNDRITCQKEVTVGSITSGKCGENVIYSLDTSTGVLTISGTGAMTNYYDENDSPFYNNSNVKSVIIENGVTSIGVGAFTRCRSLTSVTIPDSVRNIGSSAFYGCTSLTSVTIPDSVTSIGYNAFYDCRSLTSVIIPDSVTSIGEYAFYNCVSLTSVTIPNCVTSIGEYTFYNCKSLTDVYYTGTENEWNKITIDDHNENLTGATIHYNSVPCTENHNYGEWKTIEEATCTKAGLKQRTCSFDGNVQKEEIPAKGHTEVVINGYAATCEKSGLTDGKKCSVCGEVLEAQKEIPKLDHSYIKTVVEPTCTEQGYTIYKCETCGDTKNADYVNAIDHDFSNNAQFCLNGCGKVNPNYVAPDTSTVQTGSCGDNVIYSLNTETGVLTISGTGEMTDSPFSQNSSIKSVIIENGVTSIVTYAFSGCTSLTSITIPDSVVSIGESAFDGCTSLVSVTLSKSITTIEYSTFFGCSSLTSIEIPKSVTTIVNFAFCGCTNLKDVYYAGTQSEWNKINIGHSNEFLTNASLHCSSTPTPEPTPTPTPEPTPTPNPAPHPSTQPTQEAPQQQAAQQTAQQPSVKNDTAAEQVSVAKPKSVSPKKVKSAKKAVSVEWKKVGGIKGYQIQVATDKKFKKNKKTVTVKKQKTTKTTVKKLKAKKKYYVRVRTYKIVNGKKVYSSWSKVKSVKTK